MQLFKKSDDDFFIDLDNESLPILWVKFGILLWLSGIGLSLIVAGGFGIYYLLFLILGSVCLITCPCIGIGIIGATVGIWASMVMAATYIMVFTSAIATILGILGPMTLIQEDNRNEETISMVTIYFLFNLLVGYYIGDIGVYKVLFGNGTVSNVIGNM